MPENWDSRVDRKKKLGAEFRSSPANEPENNTMEQQTGRKRDVLPKGVTKSNPGGRD
jgi:hypothetical protein